MGLGDAAGIQVEIEEDPLYVPPIEEYSFVKVRQAYMKTSWQLEQEEKENNDKDNAKQPDIGSCI